MSTPEHVARLEACAATFASAIDEEDKKFWPLVAADIVLTTCEHTLMREALEKMTPGWVWLSGHNAVNDLVRETLALLKDQTDV